MSQRTDIDQQHLAAIIEGRAELDEKDAANIAAELGLPINALFANTKLPLSEIPDFRKQPPQPAPMKPGVIKALGYVEKISLSLASLDLDLSISDEVRKYTGPMNRKAAKALAKEWRARWAITDDDQLEWRNANTVYTHLRGFIESLGIFVLHFSMDTDKVAGLYTKLDSGPHTIVINRSSGSKARRLFTLAHEFCHVLLRQSGISNPTLRKNSVERFCNQFAGYLLAPASVIKRGLDRYRYSPSIDGDCLRLLSANLGISQQCLLLRLIDMGVLPVSDYQKWRGRFVDRVPPEDLKPESGGGGGNDPIRDKRTYYGSSFLSKLTVARKKGLLDAIDIYRLAGIKPKYQNELLRG